jgi:hypothetical protein
MLSPEEALHTAARRFCIERANEWKEKYAEIARRNEGPAKSGLLKKLGLTTQKKSREGLETYPRYQILDAILVEIERRDASSLNSLDEARAWVLAAAEAAYEEEARPPDLIMSIDDLKGPDSFAKMQEAMERLGPKAKVVAGRERDNERRTRLTAMQEERDAFGTFVSSCSADDLASVEPLPYRRTLSEAQSERLWGVLKTRWGVEGQWYPHDRAETDGSPENTVAFQSDPFFDRRLVESLQELLRRSGVRHVYELREGISSADCEIDLELLRPWYNFDEGFWFDESADWLIYASHEGSVTIGGGRLLPELRAVWRNWSEYVYTGHESGMERQIAPGVWSTSVDVEPPPGWDPPPDR